MTDAELTPAEVGRIIRRIDLRFAMALAELEEAAAGGPARPGEILDFMPLAAAAGAAGLPGEIVAENDDSIVVGLRHSGPVLEVEIAAVGFSRADEVAGCRANLRSRDRSVDYDFRFDQTGRAAFTLSASPEVVRALLDGWQLLIAL